MAREYVTEDGKSWKGNRLEGEGYRAVMAEIRMMDWGDPYGTASEWWFATAEIVYVETGERVEGFTPSPMRTVGDWDSLPEDYAILETAELFSERHCEIDDLKRVNLILGRYLAWCKLADRDY